MGYKKVMKSISRQPFTRKLSDKTFNRQVFWLSRFSDTFPFKALNSGM